MNKLEKTGNEEYKFVLEQYTKLLEGFLLKKKTEPHFIGGIPVTLSRGDVAKLFDRSYVDRDYKYSATAKVDGSRFMCFITEPSPVTKEKRFYFIDRSMDIYTLTNKNKLQMKTVNLPRMLLDGEMLFYKNKKSYHHLPQFETEYLTFMVFDILFGPSDLYFMDIFTESEPHFREAVAMAGPQGGQKWNYKSRYAVLKKLFMPSKDNNNLPPLPMKTIDNAFFRIELKNMVPMKDLSGVKDVEEHVYKTFKEHRKKFYDFISSKTEEAKLNNINRIIRNTKINYDGIIFNPMDTEYVFYTWKNYKNVQFKWKPSNEQTVDFKIEKTRDTVELETSSQVYNKVKLYFKRFDKKANKELSVPWSPGREEPRFGLIPEEIEVKDGTVCEFTVDLESGYFIFTRTRELKGPNALMTIKSVIELVKYPVDINTISKVLTKEPLSKQTESNIIDVLNNYLTKEQKLKILMCLGNIEIITKEQRDKIVKFVNNSTRFLPKVEDYIIPGDEAKTDKPFAVPGIEDLGVEMWRQMREIHINKNRPTEELIVYLGENTTKEHFDNIKIMMKSINWESSSILSRDYTTNKKETRKYLFPELNEYVSIYTRETSKQETVTLKTKSIVQSNIVFYMNEYKYLDTDYDPEAFMSDKYSNTSMEVFTDPNKRIKLIFETKNYVVPRNYTEYNIYITEAEYYTMDYDSVYRFIEFYLNY